MAALRGWKVQNGSGKVPAQLEFTIAGVFPPKGNELVRGVSYIIRVSIVAKIKFLNFLPEGPATLFLRRRDGRAVECGGLENR